MAEDRSEVHADSATSSPIRWLRRAVAAGIKTFLLSALALAGIYFAHPDKTKSSLESLSSFRPKTMFLLIEDAMNECVPGLDQPPPNLSPKPRLDEPPPNLSQNPRPDALTITKGLGPAACRVKVGKGGEDLPSPGRWVARLDQLSVPRLPLITPMIAMADVGLHLALAPSAAMKFLALTQLLFGFGITAAILRLLDGRLNEYGFAFLLFLVTLMIGSAIGWLLLILISQILAGMESVVRLPALRLILASAGALAGLGFVTRQFLEWSGDKAKDEITDSLADKAAELLLRYIV